MLARGFLRFALAGLTILAFSGCFEDAKGTSSSGSASGGDTDGCPEGSEGCDCYGNNSCDASLECTEGKCLSPGCTPGEENCSCNGGLCLGTLECQENVCKPGSAGTSSSTTGTTSDTASASATTTTTDSASASDTMTSLTVGTTGSACEVQPQDDECALCVKDLCCLEYEDCAGDVSCACLLDCTANGGDPPGCVGECGMTPLFPPLEGCVQDACPVPCNDQQCDIPMGVPECTACLGQHCCDLLMQCTGDPECECFEACMADANIPEADCLAQCGVATPDDVPLWPDIKQCSLDNGCQDTGLALDCYGG